MIMPPPSFQAAFNNYNENLQSFNQLVLPHVMLWHPLVQLPSYSETLKVCPIDGCNSILNLHGWTSGTSSGRQPRILHDINYIVLLVGAIYRCDGEVSHTVYSTDPKIINKINTIWLPFFLLHRSGFTRTFVQCLVNLVYEGLSIQAIARHIQNQREEYICELMIKLNSLRVLHGFVQDLASDTTSGHVKLISEPYPSNDIIARCFIIKFQQNEHLYSSHMASLKVTNCIRLDHTFKIASNIGYLRPDKKWVTLYNSIFIVLNEVGQVVTWQFTKTNSFDEVTPLLHNLKERIKENTFTVYVDNCCQCKLKLKAIFGNDLIVKLDVFHAVQRVTRVLSKKHILYLPCINDFKMIFRDPADISKSRLHDTPSSDQILSNLESFLVKWRNSEHNGCKILTDKVLEQIYALQRHVKQGCLSNIELGGGTNLNEALHRSINPHFRHAGRIGLPLAFALLTVLFYNYNIKKKSNTHTIADMLTTDIVLSDSPSFGIVKKDTSYVKNKWITGNCSDFIEPTGNDIEDALYQVEENEYVIPGVNIERIVKNALCSASLAESLQNLSGKSPTFSYHMMPFMSEVPYLYFHSLQNDTCNNKAVHDERLSSVLKGWGVIKQPIEGDGNCCFRAVAFSIINNLNNLTDSEKELLATSGIDISVDIGSMAARLRKLVVAEWKQNISTYQEFMVSVDINTEAEKFLESGFFYGDLADTIILALANVLRANIVVFSSIKCHPVFCISPRKQDISFPFMVAFTQCGSGHYDGILIKCNAINDTPKKACSCGKNDKLNQAHCHEMKSKYTTVIRCICLRNNRGCQECCTCKNCSNPLGNKLSGDRPRQKRYRYEWQSYPHMSSVQFAVQKKEDVSTGPLTILEFFIFENILAYCDEEGIEQTPANIIQIYKQVLTSVDNSGVVLPLTDKTTEQASIFIKMHLKLSTTFEVLCESQIDWNSCKEILDKHD